MFVKSYLILGVAICLLTALAHARGWQTPGLAGAGGGSSYGGYGSGTSSRGSGGFFSGWGGGK